MATPNETAPLLLRPAEAARALGCSVRTVWRLASMGMLTPIKIGRLTRFRLADLRRVAEEGAAH